MKKYPILFVVILVLVFCIFGVSSAADNYYPPCTPTSSWGWYLNRFFESMGVQPIDKFKDDSVTLSLSRQDSLEVEKAYKGISGYGLTKIQKSNEMFIGKMEMQLIDQCSDGGVGSATLCGIWFEGVGYYTYPDSGQQVEGKIEICIQNQDPSYDAGWVAWNYPQVNGVMNWAGAASPMNFQLYGQGWYRITDLNNLVDPFEYDRGRVFIDGKWAITHKLYFDPTLWTTKFSGTIYAFSTRWMGRALYNGKFTSEPIAPDATSYPFSGNWKGAWTSDSEGGGGLNVSVIQKGEVVEGTMMASSGFYNGYLHFDGSVNAGVIEWVTASYNGYYLSASGQLSVDDPKSMSGSYTVTHEDIGVVDTGQWYLGK